MKNIPHLASKLEKRSGKEESFNIIKKAVNGESLTDHDWAVMYSYFLPPKPKKIKNPFEWVTLACDKKESYAFCKYVFVDKGEVFAANTKTAHVLHGNNGLEDGWYDTQKGQVGNDVAIMPNIKKASSESHGRFANFFKIDSMEIIDTPSGLSYVLPWNGKGVNKKYFDLMTKSLDEFHIEYSFDGPFRVDGVISGVKCSAIIMPFNINRLNESEEYEEYTKAS